MALSREEQEALTHKPEDAFEGESPFESTPWALFKKEAPRLTSEVAQDFPVSVAAGIPFGVGTGIAATASSLFGPESHSEALARQRKLEQQAEERSPITSLAGGLLGAAPAYKAASVAGRLLANPVSSATTAARFLKGLVADAPTAAVAGLDTAIRTESPEQTALATTGGLLLSPVQRAARSAGRLLGETTGRAGRLLETVVSSTPTTVISAVNAPEPQAGARAWLNWALSSVPDQKAKAKESAYFAPTRSIEAQESRRQALRRLRGVEKIPEERLPERRPAGEGLIREMQNKAASKFAMNRISGVVRKQENPQTTQRVLEDAPIAIQFPVDNKIINAWMREGRMKNMFETGSSQGVNDKAIRQSMEQNTLGVPSYYSASQRPIYGALHVDKARNATNWQQGAAPSYGDAWFELKPEVKRRSTFTNGDSFFTQDVMPEASVSRFGDIGVLDNSYIEAQIHGGVDLGRDISAIHVPEYVTQNKKDDFDTLVQMAKRFKIPVVIEGQDSTGNPMSYVFQGARK